MAEQINPGRYSIAPPRRTARCFPVEQRPHLYLAALVLTWAPWLCYSVFELFLACKITRTPGQRTEGVWIAIAAEFVLTFQETVLVLGLLIGLASSRKQLPRKTYEVVGQFGPTIDVLITCCGEAIDVILDTVKAAAAQDYPADCFRVLVLDDKRDDRLRRCLLDLKPWLEERNFARVQYLSREAKKGTKSYFKAGNLNYGINACLEQSSPSQFFAGLDCDMIAEPDWLRKCVAHMLLNDRIGMVVSPQRYYNVPPGDPLGQQADLSMYFTIQEVLNDASNACMCTGTGYVARRKAIESIGGWPLAESGEDYMCSALLSDAGWDIAFIRDNLQYGLCPESLRVLLKQRMRWTDAGIEVHRNFGFYFGHTSLIAHMDVSQRAVNILYMLRDYAPLAVVLALAVLPYELHSPAVLTTSPPDLSGLDTSFQILRYLLVTSLISNKLFHLIFYNHVGLSRVWYFQSNEIWAAPYMAYRALLSFLPHTLTFTAPSFAVCGSFPTSERSLHSRPSFLSRLYNMNALLYVAFIVYAAAPFLAHYTRGSEVCSAIWLFPGPILKLVGAVMKAAVPIKYILLPPVMPSRDTMLEVDEMGVRRVKRVWKDGEQRKGEWKVWALVAGVELLAVWGLCK